MLNFDEINNKDHLSPAEAGCWAELGNIFIWSMQLFLQLLFSYNIQFGHLTQLRFFPQTKRKPYLQKLLSGAQIRVVYFAYILMDTSVFLPWSLCVAKERNFR